MFDAVSKLHVLVIIINEIKDNKFFIHFIDIIHGGYQYYQRQQGGN